MSIEIKGLEGLEDALDGIIDNNKIDKALNDAVLMLERAARINAQKVSDTIAGTIASRVKDLIGEVYTPLEWAPYVEYGTGIEAQHPSIPGRQDVPWVYVEGLSRDSGEAQKGYTLEKAEQTVAYLRSKGLPAHYTYGRKPDPFMRPALDNNREAVLEKLREGLIQK